MRLAKWTNGKRTIVGQWKYIRHSNTFLVILDSIDPVTGEQLYKKIKGDKPEWGKWRLVNVTN